MRKTLLDISKKIDKLNLEILKTVKEIADELNYEFFLVGASVRDMILNHVYGINIYRKTNDIDFAIRLKNWEEYQKLAEKIEAKGFIKSQNIMHRYTYNGMIIDLIPFGEISNDNETITWPDLNKKEMTVIGFEDVYNNTEELLICTDPDIIIKTASVEGLVLLKLFAWNERATDLRIRDAKDLYIILSTYLDAGNRDRLFDEHTDIVDDNFDYQLGGARLLGRDISKISGVPAFNALLEIMNNEKVNDLISEMAQYEDIPFERDERVDFCKKMLGSFSQGLNEYK